MHRDQKTGNPQDQKAPAEQMETTIIDIKFPTKRRYVERKQKPRLRKKEPDVSQRLWGKRYDS